jgi:hypothetical protein
LTRYRQVVELFDDLRHALPHSSSAPSSAPFTLKLIFRADQEKVESAYLLFECFDSTRGTVSYSTRLQIRGGIDAEDLRTIQPTASLENDLHLFILPRVDGRPADFPDNLLDHVWTILGHHHITMRNFLRRDPLSRAQPSSGLLVAPHLPPRNIKEASRNLLSVVLFTPGGQYRFRFQLPS